MGANNSEEIKKMKELKARKADVQKELNSLYDEIKRYNEEDKYKNSQKIKEAYNTINSLKEEKKQLNKEIKILEKASTKEKIEEKEENQNKEHDEAKTGIELEEKELYEAQEEYKKVEEELKKLAFQEQSPLNEQKIEKLKARKIELFEKIEVTKEEILLDKQEEAKAYQEAYQAEIDEYFEDEQEEVENEKSNLASLKLQLIYCENQENFINEIKAKNKRATYMEEFINKYREKVINNPAFKELVEEGYIKDVDNISYKEMLDVVDIVGKEKYNIEKGNTIVMNHADARKQEIVQDMLDTIDEVCEDKKKETKIAKYEAVESAKEFKKHCSTTMVAKFVQGVKSGYDLKLVNELASLGVDVDKYPEFGQLGIVKIDPNMGKTVKFQNGDKEIIANNLVADIVKTTDELGVEKEKASFIQEIASHTNTASSLKEVAAQMLLETGNRADKYENEEKVEAEKLIGKLKSMDIPTKGQIANAKGIAKLAARHRRRSAFKTLAKEYGMSREEMISKIDTTIKNYNEYLDEIELEERLDKLVRDGKSVDELFDKTTSFMTALEIEANATGEVDLDKTDKFLVEEILSSPINYAEIDVEIPKVIVSTESEKAVDTFAGKIKGIEEMNTSMLFPKAMINIADIYSNGYIDDYTRLKLTQDRGVVCVGQVQEADGTITTKIQEQVTNADMCYKMSSPKEMFEEIQQMRRYYSSNDMFYEDEIKGYDEELSKIEQKNNTFKVNMEKDICSYLNFEREEEVSQENDTKETESSLQNDKEEKITMTVSELQDLLEKAAEEARLDVLNEQANAEEENQELK